MTEDFQHRASFTVDTGEVYKIVNHATAPLEDRYKEVYLNIFGGGIRSIANAGESITSYCTFREEFLNDLTLSDGVDEDAGTEAIIDAEEMRQYLDFVGGESVTVSFFGNGDDRLSSVMELDGELTATIYIPTSNSYLESMLLSVTQLYDERDRWTKQSSGEPMTTNFTVDTSELNRIVRAKEFDEFSLNSYPVTIEDEELVLEATDENQRNTLTGALNAHSVDGPDVSNTYSRGFAELFGSIDGTVEVMTEQDHPLSVVYDESGMTCRYALLPTA